jgi:TolB-like protein
MSETRKIAAILVADVVGYNRLAGADEERILARLRALRSDLIEPTIAIHHGRIVKRTGDVYGMAPDRAAGAEPARPGKRSGLSLPDEPSIAVLPFQNMSGDPEQEYFSDGIREDIITALSKLRWFFVIARNSSFTYKGKAVHMKQVADELGVGYVLEGSVRKGGNRVALRPSLTTSPQGAISGRSAMTANSPTCFRCRTRLPRRSSPQSASHIIRWPRLREALRAGDFRWRRTIGRPGFT